MKDILFNPLNTKQKLWLQVIAFTSIMHKTHAKVATYRESKAKDLVKYVKQDVLKIMINSFCAIDGRMQLLYKGHIAGIESDSLGTHNRKLL